MADVVNLNNIVQEYYRRQDFGVYGNLNLNNVRVDIEHDVRPRKGTKIPHETRVEVQNGQLGPRLKTSKTLKKEIEFEILQGFCEGLHWLSEIELPNGHGTIQVNLGHRGKQTITKQGIDIVMISSSQNAKQATAPTESEIVPVFFTSKVYPRGNVIIEWTGSVQSKSIQDIIGLMKNRSCVSVSSFKSDVKGYYWIMQATCVMNVDTMHAHQWSS